VNDGALTYSTIFRSRLGVLNIALGCSDRSFAARAKIRRNLESKLKGTKLVKSSDPTWGPLLAYLVDKGFVSSAREGGSKYKLRYEREPAGTIRVFDQKDTPITEASFSIADVWLSDSRVRSTIGAPTADNVDEILDFAFQMQILSAAKGSWTSAGKLAADLRALEAQGNHETNPFIFGPEVAVFVRALFQVDGWTLKSMIGRLESLGSPFRREDMIVHFGEIVDEVGSIVKSAVRDKELLVRFANFRDLIQKNMRKRTDKSPTETMSLGVLEHRVSPRLEWLTDIRVLAKQQKNAFSYSVGEDCDAFARAAEHAGESVESRDEAALRFLVGSSWGRRELSHLVESDPFRAMMRSYALVRPPVGPARIDDVCFVAGLFLRGSNRSIDLCHNYVLELARQYQEITISGDRFSRAPRLVHVKERLWKA
jgi:hypothetical protein